MSQGVFREMLAARAYKKVRATNYSTNGYPTRVPTVTPPAPSGTGTIPDGIIPCGAGGALASPHVILIPFGTDASTHTFSLTVLGWRPTAQNPGNPQMALWVNTPICVVACTTSTTLPGIAGADVDSTQSFCTTLAMTGAGVGVSSGMAVTSPDWFTITGTAVGVGTAKVPTLGFPYLEVIFTTGGVDTDCNALWCYA